MLGAGIHRNVSFRDYLALPYPSASSLKIGHSVSMRHMHSAVNGKLDDKDTAARRFGRAFHCWLLEPERFKTEYEIQKHCMADKKNGKQCDNWGTRKDADGKWKCGVHGRGLAEIENMITGSDKRDIEGAGKSLRDRAANNVLRNVGVSELTVIAEVEGVLVKTRYDYYAMTRPTPTIVDVKKITAMKGSEEELQKTIREYQYDLQAALYKHVHTIAFGKPCEFLWLFVEDSQPHEVVPRYLSQAGQLVGEAKALPTLRRWSECIQWDKYPGYCDEPSPIDPAEWECKRYGVQSFII